MPVKIYGIATSKHVPFLILDILQEYTDCDHAMQIARIVEKLESTYGCKADRKSVKDNIIRLQEIGYDIREKGKGQGWYLCERQFSDFELRLLIDSVLYSRNIPEKHAADLIERIKSLGNKYMREKYRNVYALPKLSHSDNLDFFTNIDIIDEAITRKKQVSFFYNSYHSDKKLHPKTKNPKIINPYQLVFSNGRYYLIGNENKYNNAVNYRVDRITDIKLLETTVKPAEKVDEFKNGFNISEYLNGRPYLFGGLPETVKLRLEKGGMDFIIDWFGTNITIYDKDEKYYYIRFSANQDAVFFWAMQYAKFVEILEPQSLRSRICDTVSEMGKKYAPEKSEE